MLKLTTELNGAVFVPSCRGALPSANERVPITAG